MIPHNQIRGLTTAAGLWAVACVGLALGLGLYEIALAGGTAIFFTLGLLEKLDLSVCQNARTLEVYIELDRKIPLHQFMKSMRELDHDIMMRFMRRVEGVRYIEEL